MRNIFGIFIGVLMLAGGPAQAQQYSLTLCGASPGGLWSLLGAGIDASVKAAHPGSTITYQTSSGGAANIVQVKQGKCELGIAYDGDLVLASGGLAPFKEPVKGLRAISVLYNWAPLMWIATKDWADKYGIKDLGDIAKKKPPMRLLFNRRGLLTSQMTESVLKALGISLDDIKAWGGKVEFQASKQQAKLMLNRRADILGNTLFEGHRSIRAIAQAMDLVMLNTPDVAAEAVIKEFKLKPWTIKAGAHPWQDYPVKTVTTSVMLMVDESMSDKSAYDLTKALLDHADKMQSAHKAMRAFNSKVMIDQKAVPFHPGAVKAYKEAGLM